MGIKRVAILSALLLAVAQFAQSSPPNVTEVKRVSRQYYSDDPFGFDSPINLPVSYYNRDTPFNPAGEGVEAEGRAGIRIKEHLFGGAKDELQEARLLGFALGSLIGNRPNNPNNNQPRPFAALGLGGQTSNPFQFNPNFPNLLTTFDSCTSPNGQLGVCTPAKVCRVFGGQPSGSCILGGVCCVNTVNTCSGGTVTLNNTFWQSPADRPVDSSSTCSLNVRIDSQLVEQKKPICQVRLDFINFAIAQPDAQTVCATDFFQVGGGTNRVPTICGENANQHMYIHVPNSGITPTNLQLLFRFGNPAPNTRAPVRSWNMRISLLPCGASYLAPASCLQFFTTAGGTVRSFNFAEGGTDTRQLAEQDYNVCFRTELVNNQRASSICLSACNGVPVGSAFRVSAGPAAGQSEVAGACIADFLVFVGGTQRSDPTIQNDRFCGERFNPVTALAVNEVVCSTAQPFAFFYRTNRAELAAEAAARSSLGYCLDFTQNA